MGLFSAEAQKVSKIGYVLKTWKPNSRQEFKKYTYNKYYQSWFSEQGSLLFTVRRNEKSMTFGGENLGFKPLLLHLLILWFG